MKAMLKNRILFVIPAIFLSFGAISQHNYDNQSVIYSNSGNVGIGTASPIRKLHIDQLNGTIQIQVGRSGGNPGFADFGADGDGLHFWVGGYDGLGQEEFFIGADGNVGIGETSPQTKLAINANNFTIDDISTVMSLTATGDVSGRGDGFGPGIKFSQYGTPTGNSGILGQIGAVRTNNDKKDGKLIFQSSNDNILTTHLVINYDGNVGIGTTTPDAKLTVKGTIHTQEVTVDLQGAVAPDFVFEEDYVLQSLEDTEEFIRANKHLPEIPSAEEMEENGIELKEMNLKLLQKVEELTLYLIEQNKINKAQEDRITQLERKLDTGN